MSSSKPDPDRHPTNNDEQTNPFVAFRRFADSQMSSLFKDVFGMFQSSPIERRQKAIDDFESMLKRQDVLTQEQFEREMQEARRAMDIYLRADQDNADEARPTRADLEDDVEKPVGGMRCPYRPAEELGSQNQVLRPSALNIGYIFMSPYSPLALERQEVFQEHSGKMRAAFADLMAMQEGEGLLPDNTIEKHAHFGPLGWAANMVQMTVLGKANVWDGMHDWQNPDGRPRPWCFSPLLAEFGHFDEEKEKKIEQMETEYSLRENENEHEVPAASKRESLSHALIRLAIRMGREGEEEPDEEVEKGVTPAVRNEVLVTEPRKDEEQPEVYNNQEACLCLHCRNYERRREEFRQWRREELEEEEADEDDEENEDEQDEKTTNPTAELDQYHTLADYQAHLLKLEQQNKARLERSNSEEAELEKPDRLTTKPSILSTLTTTEQRTLPDGTVTTKVVLKKRFSDGGEEVTERVHTQNTPLPEKTLTAETPQRQDTVSQTGKNEDKKGGWFWS